MATDVYAVSTRKIAASVKKTCLVYIYTMIKYLFNKIAFQCLPFSSKSGPVSPKKTGY